MDRSRVCSLRLRRRPVCLRVPLHQKQTPPKIIRATGHHLHHHHHLHPHHHHHHHRCPVCLRDPLHQKKTPPKIWRHSDLLQNMDWNHYISGSIADYLQNRIKQLCLSATQWYSVMPPPASVVDVQLGLGQWTIPFHQYLPAPPISAQEENQFEVKPNQPSEKGQGILWWCEIEELDLVEFDIGQRSK